jgi:hypothetical protein
MASNSVRRKEVPLPPALPEPPPPSQQLPQWELPTGYREEVIDKEVSGTGAPAGGPLSHEYQGQGLNQGPPAKHRNTLRTKLDRILPSYRTYCGLSRRIFLILLALALLLLLALIIGLAAGLSKRKRYTYFLHVPRQCPPMTRRCFIFPQTDAPQQL